MIQICQDYVPFYNEEKVSEAQQNLEICQNISSNVVEQHMETVGTLYTKNQNNKYLSIEHHICQR
jgi:hypothetical protein